MMKLPSLGSVLTVAITLFWLFFAAIIIWASYSAGVQGAVGGDGATILPNSAETWGVDSFTLPDGTEVTRIDITGDSNPDLVMIDGFDPQLLPASEPLWQRLGVMAMAILAAFSTFVASIVAVRDRRLRSSDDPAIGRPAPS